LQLLLHCRQCFQVRHYCVVTRGNLIWIYDHILVRYVLHVLIVSPSLVTISVAFMLESVAMLVRSAIRWEWMVYSEIKSGNTFFFKFCITSFRMYNKNCLSFSNEILYLSEYEMSLHIRLPFTVFDFQECV
jgi:hypothetical protein